MLLTKATRKYLYSGHGVSSEEVASSKAEQCLSNYSDAELTMGEDQELLPAQKLQSTSPIGIFTRATWFRAAQLTGTIKAILRLQRVNK